MSGVLYRLGKSAARHPYRVIAVWLLLAIAAFALKSSYGGEVEDHFTVPGTESQDAYDLLEERFPSQSYAQGQIVFHVEDGALTDPAAEAAITETLAELAGADHVARVSNPYDPQVPTISADGRTAFARVDYDQDKAPKRALEDVEHTAERAEAAGVQVEADSNISSSEQAAESSELVGLIVAVIVLLVSFGSVIAMGLPIGTALFGIGIGLSGVGLLAGFTDVPEVSPMLATMIGLGVGIDYALFIVTRHRQHLHEGMAPDEAAGKANATAGQAVVFAGMTVVIAIMGLQLAGLPAVATMGYAAAIVVAISVVVAVTLLPGLLGLAGIKIDSIKLPTRKNHDDHSKTLSSKWAHHVGQHPIRYAVISLAALLALTAPVLSLRMAMADDGSAAKSTTERKAYDLVADGFGPGFSGTLQLVAELPSGTDVSALTPIVDAVAADPGVAAVSPAFTNETGDTAVVRVIPTTGPQDKLTEDLVHRLRDEVIPGAEAGTGLHAMVGGQTASFIDVSERITQRLPLFIGAVVLLSFLLLLIVFRSILVPLKAAIMNLLSIGAAYGVIVAVFQWGWGKDLFGIEQTMPVNPFVPMIMFAILFGLSMDYEVFLLSRVREEFLRHGDSHQSVVDGLGATARVITSAALIMISVFGAFIFGSEEILKMFGLGLATAVLIDATLVRMVLVPATMSMLGSANWWLPKWLDRILPHLDLEGASEPEVSETEEEVEPLAA